jgi:hypothetical protein
MSRGRARGLSFSTSKHDEVAREYYRSARAEAEEANRLLNVGDCFSAYRHVIRAQADISTGATHAEAGYGAGRGVAAEALPGAATSALVTARGEFARRCVRRRGSR